MSTSIITHFKTIWSLLDATTKRQIIPLFFVMVLMATMEMVGIGLLFAWLQIITGATNNASDEIYYYYNLFFNNSNSGILLSGIVVGIFFLIKNSLIFFLNYYQSSFIYKKHAKFTLDLFKTYIDSGYQFLSGKNSAEVQRNLTESAIQVYINGLLLFLNLILELLTITGVIIFLLHLDPYITLGLGTFMLVMILAYQSVLGPRVADWGAKVNIRQARILQGISEGVGGIKDIEVLQCGSTFSAKLDTSLREIAHYRTFLSISSYGPRLYVESLMVLSVLAVIVLLSLRHPEAMVSMAGVFGASAIRLMPSANRLLSIHSSIKSGVAAVAALAADWNEIQNLRRRQRLSTPTSDWMNPQLSVQSLRLEQISYTYPEKQTPALDKVSIEIQRGEMVALVGRSGAGKSTLADIILGLLPPDSGHLSINDQTDTALEQLRSRVGFVSQTIFILDDTLRRNIAFGIADADIDEDRLKQVMDKAELTDIVSALPQGLETRLGERGVKLSGGQRQRVGIARAFYRDPDLIVLDEATSAMDNETEHKISQALENVRRDKALLIIAHRLSTVRHCEKIILMEQGRVVDMGNFEALMSRQSSFRTMVELGQIDGATSQS